MLAHWTLRNELKRNSNQNTYFSFRKMHLKMSFAKWWPFQLSRGRWVLMHIFCTCRSWMVVLLACNIIISEFARIGPEYITRGIVSSIIRMLMQGLLIKSRSIWWYTIIYSSADFLFSQYPSVWFDLKGHVYIQQTNLNVYTINCYIWYQPC